MNRPTLGAYMIVKDEQSKIDRCIGSFISEVDQLVVVDTGSTDATMSMLRAWQTLYPEKVVVEERKWTNFSEMRNEALALVTTDWCLIIDADEWFPAEDEVGVQTWPLIWRAITEKNEDCDAFYILLRNILPENQSLSGDLGKMLRLHPNRPELHWVGGVHNQIQFSIVENPRNGESPKFGFINVILMHDGYNLKGEEKVKKYKARIPLMQAEISRWLKEGHSIREHYYRFQLAVAYHMIDDKPGCVEKAKAVDIDQLDFDNRISFLTTVTSAALTINDPVHKEWALALLKLVPHEPMAHMQTGLSFLRLNSLEKAEEFLLSAMILNNSPRSDRRYNLSTPYLAGILGDILVGRQDYLSAEVMLTYHLSIFDNHELRGKKEAIDRYIDNNLTVLFPQDGGDPVVHIDFGDDNGPETALH